ncbi:hypothetical protein AVEN_82062-1 [Araneus ventricosus]|uniref:Uncharacterized protein n=1 Tax=Araneus ventricosus TaxID=182803 RepID=A0A4Y2U7H1_ARAVE|nr:hypothetical protein AVEN_82062-1 [Araneus ventricosus]
MYIPETFRYYMSSLEMMGTCREKTHVATTRTFRIHDRRNSIRGARRINECRRRHRSRTAGVQTGANQYGQETVLKISHQSACCRAMNGHGRVWMKTIRAPFHIQLLSPSLKTLITSTQTIRRDIHSLQTSVVVGMDF